MLRVPLNSVDETNAEFCIYKRTFFRGRVPVKLLNTPTAFVDNTQGTSWESESDVLFLVCKNTVDIVKFEYSSHELVTVDTLLFPFQARNAASLVVPHWKDAFMLLISCEKNMLLVIEYSCVTQRLVPYRLLKLELSDKDLLGSHLCVDPFSNFVFLGSFGETHFCIYGDFLIQRERTVQPCSLSFPPCELVPQNIFGTNILHLPDKVIRDVIFCVQDETLINFQILAILLVDCFQRRHYIYFYSLCSQQHSLTLKYAIPLGDLTGENVSLRMELMFWNSFSILHEEKKLSIFGRDKMLIISLDAPWFRSLYEDTIYQVDDKSSFVEQLKSHSKIIPIYLPATVAQETKCIAFVSSCLSLGGGIRYFALYEDGSLIALREGSLEIQTTSSAILVAQDIPNKSILFPCKTNRCIANNSHSCTFYAISSTRGLLSFHLVWDREEQTDCCYRCEKLAEIPFYSPVLHVAKNSLQQDNQVAAMFSSAFGIDTHSGVWEMYKDIPLELLSHHEEKWHEECIKIQSLPCNAKDAFDSLVVISFLHSTRILQYDIHENCFVENNPICFQLTQPTIYCACIERENFLQIHRKGIRLSLLKENDRETVDWNPFPDWEILQATSENHMVAVQWSHQHYQIYLLQVIPLSGTIQVTQVLELSCQISYFCLQLEKQDPRIWIGTYEGTLELYNLTTMHHSLRFSLDNLFLELPKCSSPPPIDMPNMVTTRIESLICTRSRIFLGTRDGYLWILTFQDSHFQVCYGKSLGTAPLQLFLWFTDGAYTSMILGLCGSRLWWITERDERFYFRLLQWSHILEEELSNDSCILCPFHGWSENPTFFISTMKQLALLQVPFSDYFSESCWYSKIYHVPHMTMKTQKYFITTSDGPLRESNVNILVVKKTTKAHVYSSYEVQAWTCDMKTMLAHLVLPSHTAVTSICVWKQYLLIGATEESILYSDIRMPNTKGRVVLLQLTSCRFMVNCEFLLPGAVMVVTPFDDETLLVSCNEHLLAFAMDPHEQTLVEIARGETRGLVLVITVEYPYVLVGDRKDSVHIYYIHTLNHEIVPVGQDEYRKLVTSLAVLSYCHEDSGRLVFLGDRQSKLHILWCPWKHCHITNDQQDFLTNHISSMTCLSSIDWQEIPIHLSLITSYSLDTQRDISAILASPEKLMVTSLDGTWCQLVLIRSQYAKILWKLQQVVDQLFGWPVDSNRLLDGDRLVWFLSSKYTTKLSTWGHLTDSETSQLRHLLYFLEDLVHSCDI